MEERINRRQAADVQAEKMMRLRAFYSTRL
jgi:hypothetical protein